MGLDPKWPGSGAARELPDSPGRPAGRRLALDVLTAGLAAIFLYRSLWLPLTVLDRFGADFHNYYDAAVRILAGRSPYEVGGFDYPPLTALIALPVAWLPYPEARVAWLLVNWLCLVVAGLLLVRILGDDRATTGAIERGLAWILAKKNPRGWGDFPGLETNLERTCDGIDALCKYRAFRAADPKAAVRLWGYVP